MSRKSRSWFLVCNRAAVVAIVLLDWTNPVEAVVGMLLGLPIVLASVSDDPREVWVTFGVALAGYLVATQFGRGPLSPAAVWVPDRILAGLTLPAGCAVGLMLQRRRVEADRVRDQAVQAGDMNRLMMSLLAHDLRSPLGMAVQAFDYLEKSVSSGQPIEVSLLSDVQARLSRNLATVDNILNLARSEAEGSASTDRLQRLSGPEIVGDLEAEVRYFATEATARGSRLHVELKSANEGQYLVDMLVLRQTLAILVDNAVRHARPGMIRITGGVSDDAVTLIVKDDGPSRVSDERGATDSAGARLGLQLCRALVSRAGGSLIADLDREQGSTVRINLRLARDRGGTPPASGATFQG